MKPRSLYFLLFLVIAAQGRFASVVLSESLQLNSAQVGWVLGLGKMSSLISTPFWTKRADVHGYRPVLQEMVCLQLSSYVLLVICKLFFMGNNNAVYAFAMLSRFLAFSCILPATSVLDAYTLFVIEDKAEYGQERLFGALARATGNVLLGIAMDAQSALDSLAVCGLMLVMSSLLFLVVIRRMPDEEKEEYEGGVRIVDVAGLMEEQSTFKPKFDWKEKSMLLFLVCISMVMGIASSVAENLMFLFLRQDLESSYTVCGLTVFVAAMFEVPVLYWGKPLLLRFGLNELFLVAMGMICARILLNTVLKSAALILLIEPLQGFSNAMIQLASVTFMDNRVAASNAARGQGYTLMFRSFGALLGATAGGSMMDTMGSVAMFASVAGIIASAMLTLVCVGFDTTQRHDETLQELLLL